MARSNSNSQQRPNQPPPTNEAIDRRPPDTGKLVKQLLDTSAYKSRFQQIFDSRANQVMASVITLAQSYELQSCDPNAIIGECLKAACLDLSLDKNLGQAFVIGYRKNGKKVPQLQLGWRAYVQFALRTNKYKRMDVRAVNEEAFGGWDE